MPHLRLSLITTAVGFCILLPGHSVGQPAGSSTLIADACPAGRLEVGTILHLDLERFGNDVRFRPGSTHEWSLLRAIYKKNQEIIPAGSRLRIVIGNAPHRKPKWKTFARNTLATFKDPGVWKRDPDFSVQDANLILPDGTTTPLDLSVIRFTSGPQTGGTQKNVREARGGPAAEDRTAAEKQASAPADKNRKRRILIVRLNHPVLLPEAERASASTAPASVSGEPVTIQAGAQIRLMLLSSLQASKNHQGDVVQARLLEPVEQNGRPVLSEGDLFEARITRLVAPRRLQRGGSFRLSLSLLAREGSAKVPISTSVVSAETSQGGKLAVDEEGTLRAAPQGKKVQLARLGISFLAGKIADDIFETGLKLTIADLSTATAATAARYVGIGTALLTFLGSHGRDVTLPQFSELDLTLTHPVTVDLR
jgi:hypothetical protein